MPYGHCLQNLTSPFSYQGHQESLYLKNESKKLLNLKSEERKKPFPMQFGDQRERA
ncbi:hypothetical protein HMPREF0204_14807 [Chryseobacterium gleum ATCC 35910]|uniref:Uncharacterized protein n=1 Tax=Chryseobacterium gleum ATCC 35910 TaxID=525257 RepID=A0ABN0ARL2_CHRGE|nr:hypothetical protein HMPREF0204_14807 [Chryseobacterium gleum ATCC 35910]